MTPKEHTHAAINEIAEAHGYTVEDILGPSRLKHLVSVRRLCVLMFRDRGYSSNETGRIMNRCHTTIGHALNKTVDRCNEVVDRQASNNERPTT